MKIDKETRQESIKLILGLFTFILSFAFKGIFHYIFLAVSYLTLGYEIIYEAFRNLFQGHLLDENFLMAVATISAIILKDYNEAVFVILFYSIGEFAQDLASDKARDSISDLIDLSPDFVHVNNQDVLPGDVRVGTVFTVLPGERIPLDGIVVRGMSFLDTKSVTGESVPVSCSVDSKVISGSIVLDSPIDIKSTKEYSDSTVARIMKLIEQNESTKAPAEKFITKFAKYYTPIVVGLAVALAIIPSLITGSWSTWVYRSLNFMVISCPCALVLSIPLAFFSGIGGCATKGILVKGAEHLEKLAKTEAVIFDKTGTLTKGEFKVQTVQAVNDYNSEDILKMALAVESSSKHPIARAIVRHCQENNISTDKADSITEKTGFGLTGNLKKKTLLVGSDKLLQENKIEFSLSRETGTVVYVAFNGIFAGYIVISDSIKDEAKQAIIDLKKSGIKKTVMLSGDNEKTAKKVAELLDLDLYFANLLPHEKTEKLKGLKKDYICTYCGDGINDIPVMLESDTAIAMGAIGSDAAVEASGIVFTNDDLSKLSESIRKAKKTMAIVRQNIAFSIICKVLCLALGAFGITGLTLAIFADTGVALLAVLNSIRALN